MKSKSLIRVLGSGSSGNCILVYDSRGKCCMLDMGLPWKKGIKKGLNFDLACISLALATHDHETDHTKSLDHCILEGIPCYANEDVCSKHKGCNLLKCGDKVTVDGFAVQTFELVHNIPNNAFVIDTCDGIRILYCTDTQYIPQAPKGVHYAIIECNHDFDIVLENQLNNEQSRSCFQYHHSLQKCVSYLKHIYNPDLQAIILSHISDTNGDPTLFVKRVKEELGFDSVFAADKGLTTPLQLSEF